MFLFQTRINIVVTSNDLLFLKLQYTLFFSESMMSDLKGKVVLITGASSGIGAGTAKKFASLHCKLALSGRNTAALAKIAEECKNEGAEEVVSIITDLAHPGACCSVVSETVARFKRLDVLVNSAGILISGSTESTSLEDFDECWNINTRAAFILTKAALTPLLETKGSIVHVSSVTGNYSLSSFRSNLFDNQLSRS